jgi:hypothetical protein
MIDELVVFLVNLLVRMSNRKALDVGSISIQKCNPPRIVSKISFWPLMSMECCTWKQYTYSLSCKQVSGTDKPHYRFAKTMHSGEKCFNITNAHCSR